MIRFSVALFGGPVVEVGESRAPLSRYEALLVAIVFGHGDQGLGRAKAAEFLWGAGREKPARHRLSQLMYRLAGKLGGAQIVQTIGDRIVRSASDVACDLDVFEAALVSGQLLEAQTLMAPGFLSQLGRLPTHDFELWVTGRSVGLTRNLRERATSLWTRAHPAGDWPKARVAAEVMNRLEPEDEGVLRRFLLSTAMVGAVHEAQSAYRAFANRIDVAGAAWVPEPETALLVERIRSLESETDPAAPRFQLSLAPEAPLCGRDGELARLRSYVGSAPESDPVCVLLSGEGGIGKTRLVEEALVAATLSGVLVLRGRSSEFEREIPLNPLLEALNHPAVGRALDRLEDPWRTVMLALMPQFHRGDEPLQDLGYIQPGSVPRRLFEAVHRLLLAVVDEQPTCLFIDDLHWSDETSLTVLEFLRRRWSTGGLTMVFAVRPEILLPGTPWTRFRNELLASRVVQSVDLAELSDLAATELVDAVVRPTPPRHLVRELRALSGNNPFFLIELALEYMAGRFQPRKELVGELPVPLSIRQVFEPRLGLLSIGGRNLCSMLSVVNRPVEVHELALLAGFRSSGLSVRLDELARLRLIEWDREGVTLLHPLLRECVYRDLTAPRRSWLHRRVADHLEAATGPVPVQELALHFHRAGASVQANRYGRLAADLAEDSGAIPEALQYLKLVLENCDNSEDEVDILSRLAHLNYLHRNLDEAGPLLRLVANRLKDQGQIEAGLEAEALGLDALSQRSLLSVVEVHAELGRIREQAEAGRFLRARARGIDVEARLCQRNMDVVGLRRVLAEAKSIAHEGPPPARCWIYAALALSGTTEAPDEALAAVRKGVRIARMAQLRPELLTLLSRLVAVMIPLGLLATTEGSQALEAAEMLAKDSGDLFQKFNVRMNHGVWLMETGYSARAREHFAKARSILSDTHAVTARIILDYNVGELLLRDGEYENAVLELRRAEAAWTPGVPDFGRHMISAGLGLCHLQLGDLREARRREETLIPDQDHWFFNPLIVLTFRARLLERRGRRERAADYLAEQALRLSERRVVTWIHLKLQEARLRRRFDRSGMVKVLDAIEPVIRDHALGGMAPLIRRIGSS